MTVTARQWVRRLRRLFDRRAIERSMADEMQHHIESETADYIRRGMSAAEARRAALLAFGSIERFKEEGRDARGTRPLEDLALDIRYAARLLRRNPWFTTAAVLTFALGAGAATAIFSVVYGVLLRPLPYAEPSRLVALWEHNVPRNRDRNVVSVENFEAWTARSRSFAGMAALVPRSVTLAEGAVPERIPGAEVSPGYFSLLGVAPAMGRDFNQGDARTGATATIILSNGFWKSRFGSDPAAVGRTLRFGGVAHTIVGVMPAHFEPPQFGWLGRQDVWFPFVATPANRAWGRALLVVGRLRGGVTLEESRTEMAAIANQRSIEAPGNKGWSVTVVPLADQISGDVRTAFLVLLGAVVLLLAIAVTNVATLTLSLTRRREDELAIRRAVGATDARLFRQLFAQSALLGALGTSVGVLAAWPMVRILIGLLPPDVPRVTSIRMDGPVLLITTGVALLATVVCGTTSAARGRRSGLGSAAWRQAVGRASQPGGAALVVLEIALGLALTVMAVLMVRSLVSLRSVDLGFDAEDVVVARVALTGERYASSAQHTAFFDTLLERVRALPGVQAAGIVSARPFGGLGPATKVSDPRAAPVADGQQTVADIRYADSGFFAALRIRLLRGALFLGRPDASRGRPRVVIDDTLASALWPGQDPIGRDISLVLYGGITGEVVGVVAGVHLFDARTSPRPAAYLSAAEFPSDLRDLVVRGDDSTAGMIASLRSAAAALDPTLPLYQIATLPELVSDSMAGERFTTILLGAFAVVALTLAGVGVFGVFSGDVARRRKEIGIRVALGARKSEVVLLVLRQAMQRAAVGVAVGAILALVLARWMASLLFGVVASDPVSFAVTGILVLGLAAVATLIPTLRALACSPVATLRES